jgi:hypothetical protein
MMAFLRTYFSVIKNYLTPFEEFLLKSQPTPPAQFPFAFLGVLGLLALLVFLVHYLSFSLKKPLLNFLLALLFGLAIYLFLWWEGIPYLTMPLLWLPFVFYLLLKFFLIVLAIFAFLKEGREKDEKKIQKLVEYF